MTYSVVYEKSAQKDVRDLPASVIKAIRKAIDTRLTTRPVDYGKPLRRSLKGYRRIRMDDYRIIYRIDENIKTVYVAAIGHRKDVYGQ